jgi:hypothetical protein
VHVKEALAEELATFSLCERVSTDFDALLRADYKVRNHKPQTYHKPQRASHRHPCGFMCQPLTDALCL